MRVEAGIGAKEIGKGPDKQAGPDEENERKRGLQANHRGAQASAPGAQAGGARPFFKRLVQIGARCRESRRKAGKETGEHGDAGREEQRPGVECSLLDARQAGRRKRQKRV